MKKTSNTIGPIQEWLMKRLLSSDEQYEKLGDFQEAYRTVVSDRGRLYALAWYWGQLFLAMPSFLSNSMYRRSVMFKSYVIIALRNLLRNKGYAAMNISGLAIGLTACTLILLYVRFELSYDTHHPNADRIYRIIKQEPGNNILGSDTGALTPLPLSSTLINDYPEIVTAMKMRIERDGLMTYGEKNFVESKIYIADPSIFDVFSPELISGNPATALHAPDAIVISERMAEKYFGNDDPVGKVLTFKQEHNLTVTGVLRNFPLSTHFIVDFLVPFRTVIHDPDNKLFNQWGYNSFYTYVLLSEDADPLSLENKFKTFIDRVFDYGTDVSDNEKMRYLLQPVQDIHLRPNIKYEIQTSSDIKYVYFISSIGLLILAMACVNYMNLATAYSSRRAREVGIRKVAGAKRGQLAGQFIGESLAATLIAAVVSLVLTFISLPYFNMIVDRQLNFDALSNIFFALQLFGIFVVIGLVSGAYPAFYLASFLPTAALKTRFSKISKRFSLRNTLVVAQFSVSVLLIICTLTVSEQIQFIRSKDMGFDKEQIVVVRIEDRNVRSNMDAFKEELAKNPNIVSVTSSNNLPNQINSNVTAYWPGRPNDIRVGLYAAQVGYNFGDVFGLEIVEGRDFSKNFPSDAEGAFLLNESAVAALGWEEPIGRELRHWNGKFGKVVGVLKDFHMRSLHEKIQPLYLYLVHKNTNNNVSVKIKGDNIPETLAYMQETFKGFSSYPFNYSFFDETFDRVYQNEQKLGYVFSVFSGLALFIGCLGLLGLFSFTVRQKTKEIGVRKILGARVSRLVGILSGEFTGLILLANIIAWPLSYYAMNAWLQTFVYRISMSWYTFAIAGAVSLAIGLVTLSFQTVKAALQNPVNVLRTE